MSEEEVFENFSMGQLSLKSTDVEQRQAMLLQFMEQNNLHLLMVSSQDGFLSEYTPAVNNVRTAISGFTGSVGDGVFFNLDLQQVMALSGPFVLAVDGRYHLQVEQEVLPHLVVPLLKPLQSDLENALFDMIKTAVQCFMEVQPSRSGCLRIGLDPCRISVLRLANLKNCLQRDGLLASVEFVYLQPQEMGAAITLPGWRSANPIKSLEERRTGRSLLSTHQQVMDLAFRQLGIVSDASGARDLGRANPCVLTCSTDDCAFVLNARAYHNPQQSGVMAYTFLLAQKLILFVTEETVDVSFSLAGWSRLSEDFCGAEVLGFESECAPQIVIVRNDIHKLRDILQNFSVTDLFFNQNSMNVLLPLLAEQCWPKVAIHGDFAGIETLRARKTPNELAEFRSINIRSSRAIASTLRWAKAHMGEQAQQALPKITERDLAQKIAAEYASEGAVSLSFRTIAGTGPNSAIIHYASPSAQQPLQQGEITLLDSGAYYESGFATDCTRVIFNGNGSNCSPAPWQKEIYTTTLKSLITGLRMQFYAFEEGRFVDSCIRRVVKNAGFDYAHGTGHGVGIHVHEAGVRISPVSKYPMLENACVSVEPGIYLPGKGGVRLENVVRVELQDPSAGICGFENFIWVGFDWDLIDLAKLTVEEKEWLIKYERRCGELGTAVTSCPLL